MNEEVFYGLDDDNSIDHKMSSYNSNPFAPSLNKHNVNLTKEENIMKNSNNETNDDLIILKPFNKINNSNAKIDDNNKVDIQKIKKSRFFDEAYNSKRNSLPCPRKKINLNVWGILKEAVTKDLSKFCVPGNKLKISITILKQ